MAIPVLCRDAQWFHMCPWQLPTPTPPAQSCVQSLQKSIKQWKRKEEASVARWMNYLCTGELLLLMWHCFFLIFPLSFCLKFYCCLTFFLYLFLTPFLSTVLVSTWPTFCILLSLSLPPSFFRISFLLLLEIFIHCFNFLTYFVPISFPVPFFLVCFSSFVCLCSALFYTAPFPPLSPTSPLHYSSSLAAGAAAAGIWDTPRVGWKHYMYHSHPARGEEGAAYAGPGTMGLVNRMWEFCLNVGMSHEN